MTMKLDNLSFLEKKPRITQATLLSIPLDLGKDNIGCDDGPKRLQELGITKMLTDQGVTIRAKAIVCPTRATADIGKNTLKYGQAISDTANQIAVAVCEEVKAKRAVIALGGDHSLSLGTISGASVAVKGDIGLIWIDAHGDINTPETSLSGNIHGMPVAGVLGMGPKELTGILKPGQKVNPKNVLYIGLKDLDQAEIDIMRQKKITTFTTMDIARLGLEPVFKKITALSKRVKHIWVSLDIDSVDEQYAPATPMVNKGGLTFREITSLTKYIGKTCNLVGADIVEFAPDRDVHDKTAQLIFELVANLVGGEYGWYTAYMHKEAHKQDVRARD